MKRTSIIAMLIVSAGFILPGTGFAQDSTRRPAREIIDSTSEKTEGITGRNIKKLSLRKDSVMTDSSCHRKKGKKSKSNKSGS